MNVEIAYQILCAQIDGMTKEIQAKRNKEEEIDVREHQFVAALREGAKLLNWERNCDWVVQEAVKNMTQKNYKLADRSVIIDALSKVDKKDFDFNTVCNVIRKVPSHNFKTTAELDDFIMATEMLIRDEEFKKAKEKAAEEDDIDIPVIDDPASEAEELPG